MLIVSLSISILMIKSSVEDWDKNPVTTNVERTDGTGSEDLMHPAVTICRGPKTQPDIWALTEVILDFFDFHCHVNSGGLKAAPWICNRTDRIKSDFEDILGARFTHLTEIVEDYYQKHHSKFRKEYDHYMHLKIKNLIKSNLLNITHLESFFQSRMFQSLYPRIHFLIHDKEREDKKVK